MPDTHGAPSAGASTASAGGTTAGSTTTTTTSTKTEEHGFWPFIKRMAIRQLSTTFDATVGAIMAHVITKDANGNSVPNKETLRKIGPHFAKSSDDEARFAKILACINDYGLVESILAFLANRTLIGKHQRAQFILAFAEMTCDDTPESMNKAVDLLAWFASIPEDDVRFALAAGMGFMKFDESDYLAVSVWDKAQAILGASWGWLSTRIPQAALAVGRWLTDPAGLRQFVRNAAQGVDNAARAAAPQVDIASAQVHRLADAVRGTSGNRFARFLRIR